MEGIHLKSTLSSRILELVLVLIGISVIAFFLGVISPGDPAELSLSRGGVTQPTQEQIEQTREEMGLNAPIPIQYLRWLKNVLTGHLGISYATNRPISAMLREKIPITLILSAAAFFLTCFFGIAFGTICAWNSNKPADGALSSLMNLMLSLPSFWVALLLILVFAEYLHWLPTSGFGGLKHLVLPSSVLSMATTATTGRLMRASLLKEYAQPYYTAGIARGISKWSMTFRQLMRNAILPVLPMLGNYLGGILGGSAIVESIFAIPGLGSLAISSIRMKDYPVLQAYVLLTGTLFVLIHSGIDLLIHWLYPGIRREEM